MDPFCSVVSSFSFSWKNRRDLATVQVELGLPPHQHIRVTNQVELRQKMIERVLEQEKAIAQVLTSEKSLDIFTHLAGH